MQIRRTIAAPNCASWGAHSPPRVQQPKNVTVQHARCEEGMSGVPHSIGWLHDATPMMPSIRPTPDERRRPSRPAQCRTPGALAPAWPPKLRRLGNCRCRLPDRAAPVRCKLCRRCSPLGRGRKTLACPCGDARKGRVPLAPFTDQAALQAAASATNRWRATNNRTPPPPTSANMPRVVTDSGPLSLGENRCFNKPPSPPFTSFNTLEHITPTAHQDASPLKNLPRSACDQ